MTYGTEELKAELMPISSKIDQSSLTGPSPRKKAVLVLIFIQLAVKDGDDYIINGEKFLISHTDCSNYSYITCVTDPNGKGNRRLSTFMVSADTPGYELTPMPHMMGAVVQVILA